MDEKVRQLKISTLLHSAEASIKQGEFEEALGKIRSVYTFDYKNLYAHAFEERILSLIADRKLKKKLADDAKKAAAGSAEAAASEKTGSGRFGVSYGIPMDDTPIQRVELTPEPGLSEECPEIVPEHKSGTVSEKNVPAVPDHKADTNPPKKPMLVPDQKAAEEHALEVRARAASILELIDTPAADAPPPESQTAADSGELPETNEAFRLRLEQERAKWEEEKTFLADREKLKTKERFREAYRSMFMMMSTSLPTEKMETLLVTLRGILEINEAEHAEIVRSVQVNAYIDALRSAWQKGSVTEEDRASLNALRAQCGITPEEHELFTRQVKRKLGLPEYTGGILAIDDSRDILIFIEYVLKKKYPNIRTAGSVLEAAALIRDEVPALIISDVMMPETGGFAFYDMLKRGEFGDAVKNVPFIFMSVCSDEYMKKIADNLGAQTYMTKPFSRDVLERTVKETLGY